MKIQRRTSTERLEDAVVNAFGSLEAAGVTAIAMNRLNVISNLHASNLHDRLGDLVDNVTIISPHRR